MQGAALQAVHHVAVFQCVLCIQIVRLGAERVHARALQLFNNEYREPATEGQLGGAVGGLEHRLGPGQALIECEACAVDVRSRLILIVEILGVDQDHLIETVPLPVTLHILVT